MFVTILSASCIHRINYFVRYVIASEKKHPEILTSLAVECSSTQKIPASDKSANKFYILEFLMTFRRTILYLMAIYV